MNSINHPLLCIGHRGASGYAPENTLAAFQKAIEMGVHNIELDVYFVDGQLVVFHDDELERTTNGAGMIQDRSFEYLRGLDAGEGERIPTLQEVVDLIDKRVGINIELKGPGTARPVVDMIETMRAAGWPNELILVSSFDHAQLAEMHELDPEIKIGALFFEPPADGMKTVKALGAVSFNPGGWFVTQQMVDEARAHDLRVYVYTINEPEHVEIMRKMGVDGVFTNYPDRVLDGQPPDAFEIGWN